MNLSAMKSVYILAFALCVSCSTVDQKCGTRTNNPNAAKTIALPKLAVEGVVFDDGLQMQEVIALSSEYFRQFISG
jgi:hypothetical protein